MNDLKKIAIALLLLNFNMQFITAQKEVNFTIFGKTNLPKENFYIAEKIEQNVSVFLTTLNAFTDKRSKPKFSSEIITSEAYISFLSMWEMSTFMISSNLIEEKLVKKLNGYYEIRNIPIIMNEAKDDEKKQEIVLVINSKGVIDNIYLSIETNRYNEIINAGNDVTELKRRQIIVDFVENFRTSYNRKDINFLSSVFSEDALIITGKVINVQTPNVSSDFMPQKTITYQKQTKKEYIDKLSKIFASNSYIDVKFDEIEIKQHGKYPTIYGVQMMQSWNTSRYSDKGFLLLVIDFTDEDKPLIHIRTWQPDKIGDRSLTEDEKFSVDQFNFKK